MSQWSDKQQKVPVAMEIQNPGLEVCFNSFLASGQPRNGCGWSRWVEKGKTKQKETPSTWGYLQISHLTASSCLSYLRAQGCQRLTSS